MEELQEKIASFKRGALKRVKEITAEQGGLQPMFVIYVRRDVDDELPRYGEIVIPVPEMFFQAGEKGKDMMVELLPYLFQKVCKEECPMTPLCVTWTSEGWLRKVAKGESEVPENWRELPKTEVVMVFFEDAGGAEMHLMEVLREGKTVNNEGDLVDQITLVDMDEMNDKGNQMEGRFTNLFQKLQTTTQSEKPSPTTSMPEL